MTRRRNVPSPGLLVLQLLPLLLLCLPPFVEGQQQQSQRRNPPPRPPRRYSNVGSLNGYDVGGNESICFESSSNDPLPLSLWNFASNATLSNNNDNNDDVSVHHPTAALLTLLQDVLLENHLQIEPACPTGTRVHLTPQPSALRGTRSTTYYTDQPLTHTMNLEINLTAIPSLNDNTDNNDLNSTTALYVRLVLCEIMSRGTCNPVDIFENTWNQPASPPQQGSPVVGNPPPPPPFQAETNGTSQSSSFEPNNNNNTEPTTTLFVEWQPNNNNTKTKPPHKPFREASFQTATRGDNTVVRLQVDLKRMVLFSPWIQPMANLVTAHDGSRLLQVDDFDVDFVIPHAAMPNGAQFRVVLHAMLVVRHNGEHNSIQQNATATHQQSQQSQQQRNLPPLLYRLDTANMSSVPIVTVKAPPTMLLVSAPIVWFVVALMVLYGLVAVTASLFLLYHRRHPVVRLAQGSFLIALVMVCTIGTTFLFTMLSTHNWYCFARGPLVVLPFTVVGAILVARVWRVQVTLANALQFARSTTATTTTTRNNTNRGTKKTDNDDDEDDDEQDFSDSTSSSSSSWPCCCTCTPVETIMSLLTTAARWKPRVVPFCGRHHRHAGTRLTQQKLRQSIRQSASARETVQLIVILSLPQILLQAVGWLVVQPQREFHLTASETTGRYFCSSPDETWLPKLGLVLAIVNYCLAILVAYGGRNLPSAFNEKEAIFLSACLAAVLLVVDMVIMEVTDDPNTPPDTEFFLQCMILLGTSTTLLLTLVIPKIMRVWSGEKVVMGNLLRMLDTNAAGAAESISLHTSTTTQDLDGFRSSLRLSSSATLLAGAPIHLKREDPIPRNIESQLHQLHSFLDDVTATCAQGRTLSAKSWRSLRRQIASLKMDVDRVRLNWGDGHDEQSASFLTNGATADETTGASSSSTSTSTASATTTRSSSTVRFRTPSNSDPDDDEEMVRGIVTPQSFPPTRTVAGSTPLGAGPFIADEVFLQEGATERRSSDSSSEGDVPKTLD